MTYVYECQWQVLDTSIYVVKGLLLRTNKFMLMFFFFSETACVQ